MAFQTRLTDGNGNPIYVYHNINSDRNRYALTVDPAGHILTHTAVYAANQAGIALITPTAGTRLCIRDIYLCASINTGDIELDFNTSNIPVARLYAARYQVVYALSCHMEGAIDEVLTLTTTTGNNDIFIMVNYIEET